MRHRATVSVAARHFESGFVAWSVSIFVASHRIGATMMDESRLIELVELRPYLFDPSSKQYKNLNKAAKGWKEIAGELNISGNK